MRAVGRYALAVAVAAAGALAACGARSDEGPAGADGGADLTSDGAAPSDAGAADAPLTTDAAADAGSEDAGRFTVTSVSFADGGALPAEFTCDGAGTSPPLAWSGVPAGTVELAILMSTLAKDGLKWNWVLYRLPPAPASLAPASNGGGTCGLTSDGPNLAYSPPCSLGPGPKTYTFTVYALSGRPTLPSQPNQVTGAVLGDSISTITLAKAELSVTYTRP